MTVVKDDDAERLARMDALVAKLQREIQTLRENSRTITRQMADSKAASGGATQLKPIAKSAGGRDTQTSPSSARRTRRNES